MVGFLLVTINWLVAMCVYAYVWRVGVGMAVVCLPLCLVGVCTQWPGRVVAWPGLAWHGMAWPGMAPLACMVAVCVSASRSGVVGAWGWLGADGAGWGGGGAGYTFTCNVNKIK